jgi:KaiC/GvpD/RAD55 family RecA-like ATPase
MGGLPARRATVVAGQAGSAKTVFAAQFLAEGIRAGQAGVFVTLEEPAADLRVNLGTLGFDVAGWEEQERWRFVDASPVVRSGGVTAYSLETLAAQVGHAVDATGADRLVLDSLNAVLALHEDIAVARQMLRSLIAMLRGLGLTVVLTVETPGDPGGTLSRYGIEEFVADSVVLLRNVREGTFRRRTVEVLKMRGAMHHKGDVPFTVVPGQGMVVLPVREPEQEALEDARLSTGNAELDRMTSGGLFRGSCALISGPTGTGKTLLATQFLAAGAKAGERAVLFSTRRPASRCCATRVAGVTTCRSTRRRAGCSSCRSTRRSPRWTTTSSRSGRWWGASARPASRWTACPRWSDSVRRRRTGVRHRPDLLRQGERRRQRRHRLRTGPARRLLRHREPHLRADRRDPAAAVRRGGQRGPPSPRGAEDARQRPRPADPRVHHRQLRAGDGRPLPHGRRDPRARATA